MTNVDEDCCRATRESGEESVEDGRAGMMGMIVVDSYECACV